MYMQSMEARYTYVAQWKFQPEEYTSHHHATMVDATSTINLLAGVPLSSLDMVRSARVKNSSFNGTELTFGLATGRRTS
jgi:hypothetical protein